MVDVTELWYLDLCLRGCINMSLTPRLQYYESRLYEHKKKQNHLSKTNKNKLKKANVWVNDFFSCPTKNAK